MYMGAAAGHTGRHQTGETTAKLCARTERALLICTYIRGKVDLSEGESQELRILVIIPGDFLNRVAIYSQMCSLLFVKV